MLPAPSWARMVPALLRRVQRECERGGDRTGAAVTTAMKNGSGANSVMASCCE